MAIADVLKGMRSSGYSKKMEMPEKEEKDDSESDSGPRTIMLSDDEIKSLGQSAKPGEDVEIKISGKLENDGHFHIMSVEPASTMPDDDMKEMAAKVAGMQAPMVQNQTMPSPS